MSEASFYYWRKKFEQQQEQQQQPGDPMCGSERGLSFVEVAASAECGAAIEVALVGGRRIGVHPGFDGPTLARVVEVLEATAC